MVAVDYAVMDDDAPTLSGAPISVKNVPKSTGIVSII